MRTHRALVRDQQQGEHARESQGPTLGVFMLTGSSMLAETCATLPLDWVVLDMEASPMTKQDALHMLQGLEGSTCVALVRVPFLDQHLIEHALDMGARGVVVPKVNTADEAERAVRACRFPPQGNRGINPVRASGYFSDVPGYLRRANAETVCVLQIESAEAVERADEIAAVEGADVLFMGMGDLSMALGQPTVMTGPAMDRARAAVLSAAHAHGKRAGIFAYSLELAKEYVAEGFDMIAFGNDIKLFREAVQASLGMLH